MQKAFDRGKARGYLHEDERRWHSNATEEGIMGHRLIVQTGDIDEPIDRALVSELGCSPACSHIGPVM